MPDPVDVHVGARIRRRRTALGLSQASLGQSIGISSQQIQKYERGSNRVGAGALYALARVLNVPIPYFFGNAAQSAEPEPGSQETPQPSVAPLVMSKDHMVLNTAFQKIRNPQTRHKIIELVEQLARESDESE
ncbi:helix-turn-helix transcriptional regulator [Stappia sp. F7233]|uniref:Helix-turn-helix transcriptional regulator n=1 Tax=Stappia albiluteola TaxID=2758565 RepID=A0A839AIZ3_9HYPH|nr:helix-turn-helix transcriptional regulator [Stappia albiluteola]MBA5778998.1 helix-turn-helix transcriptional regulator [Stappia albiluteola]